MKNRPYYSIRTGKHPHTKYNLDLLRRLFIEVYRKFEWDEYFQEAFGYRCVDAYNGWVSGNLGRDIEAIVFLHLRKDSLWPIEENYIHYSEEDLFDVIEFLYDNVSKPVDGFYHDYNNCGWHYSSFDQNAGKKEFREAINSILKDYKSGYELSTEGEILSLPQHGLEALFESELPHYESDNVEKRLETAIEKFRRYHATWDEKRDAIRDLADVLEYLRPRLKEVLSSKDENDLFNLANNFGIRHHNANQKTDYDKEIWYPWLFYYYLATIRACISLLSKAGNETSEKSMNEVSTDDGIYF
ncbi:hypothetical protein BECAL_03381 [Bellilinea caldifistulae]|jgi:hypothetical protein|uniref:Uncharacterized protein n=1 Tax=Bellilinea caldifistulae TaxID=360411 RepID=A0A0P6X249_9CHLR|nr:hypothetical protein [Bellilinea caldifistulae]KPL76607.1 hypothetical protein AC812_04605 [Bellilinea caldifistulae]GAP12178.1 hypothetical protein BECAL_03381 [Bellilinea caldifistulae]